MILTKAALKQLCMLTAAGGMGAGSVVTVQKTAPLLKKPGVHRAGPQKTALRKPRPAAQSAVARPDPVECTPSAPILATLDNLKPMDVPKSESVEPQTRLSVGKAPETPGFVRASFGGFSTAGGGGNGGTLASLGGEQGQTNTPRDNLPSRPIPVGPDEPVTPPVVPPATPVVTNVPEPGTWATMIAGFGLIGVALRWRRPDAPPAAAQQADG
jgi:hypothetical protein